MKLKGCLMLLWLLPRILEAQTCGYGRQNIVPGFDNWYQKTSSQITHNSKRSQYSYDTVYRIPVVFHVINPTGSAQGVSPDRLTWALNELNNDFRRRNADTSTMRWMFRDRVGDTKIEFYLADTDPQGNPSKGYEIRKSNKLFGTKLSAPYSSRHSMKFDSLEGLNAWNTQKYLNIWVCNLTASDGRVYLSGFATAPPGAGNWTSQYWGDSLIDGIVISNSILINRYYSSTLAHEVGHYLGLRHVSGDPLVVIADSCKYDDGIFDTPMVNGQNYFTCDYSLNTCIEPHNDMPDMLENFMDYSDNACRSSFTIGQINLMRHCLIELRPNLFNYNISRTQIADFIPLSFGPNPSSGTFKVYNANIESYEVELYDLTGRYLGQFNVSSGENEISLTFNTGTYYMRILDENQQLVMFEKLLIVD
ncbi:MAG: zinc-dependent metalloprotease [Bacteroidetes bacterium]|nr:zinc-dependent metalloprotease [Bacteroidota bacterium]